MKNRYKKSLNKIAYFEIHFKNGIMIYANDVICFIFDNKQQIQLSNSEGLDLISDYIPLELIERIEIIFKYGFTKFKTINLNKFF